MPFIHQGGKNYKVTLLEQDFPVTNEDELADIQKRVRSRGYYPYLTNPDEIAELEKDPERIHKIFLDEVLKVVQQWMDLADKKLDGTDLKVYCSPGNDDMDEVDDIVRSSRRVILVEGLVTQLDAHHEMIASGWSNRTPWNTEREEDEDQLKARYEAMISKLKDPKNAVFNIHVPPYNSGLDSAPELDKDLRPVLAGNSMIPVGSKALREVIEKYQPLLSLHGHIHEGRGTTRPFEIVGAPWVTAETFAERLNARDVPGAVFRPAVFEPTFHKHAKQTCGGCQIHVVDQIGRAHV